ncbi:MAG TPA: hypothetical protein GX707_03300 [Epulopiscium sp.]|nr:hypothetical protein [Candidatus Epulonipiscium sp.]
MKPRCKLVGENGNIFNLMAIAAKLSKMKATKKKRMRFQEVGLQLIRQMKLMILWRECYEW